MTAPAREVLRFDDLSKYLLLKNGNYLYKVPFRGGWAVLKVYYGSRTTFQHWTKSFGNVALANQTSFMPKTRRRVELDCVELWRSHGFRVFEVYDGVVVEGLPEDGYALFEYVPGIQFVNYFADEDVSLDDKLHWWRRFVPEWHRRHRLALDHRDPRFVHENGDLKHVMIWNDELVWFDFEMVFRSKRRIKEFVAREILSYLKSLGKTVGEEHWDLFLEETFALYDSKDMLRYTHQFAFANPNPILRAARALDRKFKPRANKPFAKYMVARKLRRMLDGLPAAEGAAPSPDV